MPPLARRPRVLRMNEYCSLAQLKAFLSIGDTVDDVVLAAALEGAARMIDEYCGRRFYLDTVASARFFSATFNTAADYSDAVEIDDISSNSGLVVQTDDGNDGVYENTLVEGVDFDLYPFNAATAPQPMPAWRIVRRLTGTRVFPYWPKGVKVTAKWGWPAIPPSVVYANLVQGSSLFKRKDAPFGIVGAADFGVGMRRLARLDADVETLLTPLRRVGRVVGVA